MTQRVINLAHQPRAPESGPSFGVLVTDDRAVESSALAERKLHVSVSHKRRYWTRRLHALLGLISAFNLLLLISTGFLLQHRDLLRLDERSVSRRVLPSFYRPDDPGQAVRADIVITDLHSGRLFGTAGTLVLDTLTLVWLIMLTTGLVMYFSKSQGKRRSRGLQDDEE